MKQVANDFLGADDFLGTEEQTACIKAIYEGKDVFLWLSAGFGKSMCYEILPFVFDDKLGRQGRIQAKGVQNFSLIIHNLRHRTASFCQQVAL